MLHGLARALGRESNAYAPEVLVQAGGLLVQSIFHSGSLPRNWQRACLAVRLAAHVPLANPEQ